MSLNKNIIYIQKVINTPGKKQIKKVRKEIFSQKYSIYLKAGGRGAKFQYLEGNIKTKEKNCMLFGFGFSCKFLFLL